MTFCPRKRGTAKEVAFDALVNQCKVADKIIRSKQKKTADQGMNKRRDKGGFADYQADRPTGLKAKAAEAVSS